MSSSRNFIPSCSFAVDHSCVNVTFGWIAPRPTTVTWYVVDMSVESLSGVAVSAVVTGPYGTWPVKYAAMACA